MSAMFAPQSAASVTAMETGATQRETRMLKLSGQADKMLARLTGRSRAIPATGSRPDYRGPAGPSKRPEDSLSIPVCDNSADDIACRAAQEHGQFLARQDRWDELAAALAEADGNRQATPGGMPVADLLAYGARTDVINAAEHALAENRPANDPPLLDGIMALEAIRQQHRSAPHITALVALAHIDIGWAWRGTGRDTVVPRVNRRRCAAHFDRASALLSGLEETAQHSPMVAAARCAMRAGLRAGCKDIADGYERLIDLDPANHRHMRALGSHMLPRWHGSYPALELEARRTAARTAGTWGAGGYTWVYFDAIAIDEDACARVDAEFFLDGLRDIVRLCPGQEMINMLAAYCAVALRSGTGLNEEADLPRLQIAAAADWLIREHLHELHPLVWAHAADGFDNSVRVTSASRFAARGRADALHFIADLVREDILGGHHVTFTPEGPRLKPV